MTIQLAPCSLEPFASSFPHTEIVRTGAERQVTASTLLHFYAKIRYSNVNTSRCASSFHK